MYRRCAAFWSEAYACSSAPRRRRRLLDRGWRRPRLLRDARAEPPPPRRWGCAARRLVMTRRPRVGGRRRLGAGARAGLPRAGEAAHGGAARALIQLGDDGASTRLPPHLRWRGDGRRRSAVGWRRRGSAMARAGGAAAAHAVVARRAAVAGGPPAEEIAAAVSRVPARGAVRGPCFAVAAPRRSHYGKPGEGPAPRSRVRKARRALLGPRWPPRRDGGVAVRCAGEPAGEYPGLRRSAGSGLR